MRIAVTGATGFIGRHLVRRLLRDGHDVTVLSRDPASAVDVPAACHVARWDPAAGVAGATAIAGAEAVVHLAGESVAGGRWTEARKRAIRDSRVAGSRALVEALAALPADRRPRTLVAASAIGLYGDRGDEALDEAAPRGSGFLADVCAAWEAETAAAADAGLRTVIVRIGIVLGRDGGALQTMLPLFRLGAAGRLGSGRQWMSWIHVDDLVELFVLALTDASVAGVLNGVAPDAVTNAAFTRTLAGAVRRPAILPAPAFALRLALGEMSSLLLASQRVVPRAALAHGFRFPNRDHGQALAALCADDGETLAYEQWVPRAPDEVFAFFCDPYNLERITPDFLRFRVRATSTPRLARGTLIDYRLSPHGIPLRWQSRIDEWEPGRRFVDSQTRGPYARWQHAHTFEPRAGGTVLRDEIRYAVPLGGLGALVAGTRVARDLHAIFAFRHRKVAELFG